jgi:predicted component of type VI protein secretion system
MSGWQLLVQQGPHAGQTFDLNKSVVNIGREANNDIVLEDSQVSRHHVRLTQQGVGYVIEDMGSTNGTFVNGQRMVGAKSLEVGDVLGLGDTVVLKVMGGAEAGETLVAAHAQPQPAPTTISTPSTFSAPPPPPPSFSAPPPPPSFGAPAAPPSFGAPPPPPPPAVQKKGPNWLVLGCGCLVVLCIAVTLIGVYLYNNPGPLNALFKMIGIDLQFQ